MARKPTVFSLLNMLLTSKYSLRVERITVDDSSSGCLDRKVHCKNAEPAHGKSYEGKVKLKEKGQ